MHQHITRIPVAVKAGDATIQSAAFGEMAMNVVRVPKGTDFGPLLKGLPGDLCQCPHWGYLLEGRIHMRFADGREETVEAGEVFYWPAGHTGWVDQDTAFLELSPAHAMEGFLDHIKKKVAAAQ
jgi:hypothetical protein